ncbi:MAG: cell division protein ZapA [Oscillospiraceae bacterium]|jgi:cell division protein ZapA|nr:cell division protein ZapA [Oscillospiraceae bacterium]
MEKNRVRLTICGVDYVLLSERSAAYMQELGNELNGHMLQLLKENGRVSATQAAVLCALEAMDAARESQAAAENLRARIQDYLEDAAQLKKEAELSRHEAELLHREIAELKRQLPGGQRPARH